MLCSSAWSSVREMKKIAVLRMIEHFGAIFGDLIKRFSMPRVSLRTHTRRETNGGLDKRIYARSEATRDHPSYLSSFWVVYSLDGDSHQAADCSWPNLRAN